jgi:hypothetical protein
LRDEVQTSCTYLALNSVAEHEQSQETALGLPWFRKHDGWWYATIEGRKVKLAKGQENKEEAVKVWHEIMAKAQAGERKNGNPCWVIFERYLDYNQAEHPGSYKRIKRRLKSFDDTLPGLLVQDLTVNLPGGLSLTLPAAMIGKRDCRSRVSGKAAS